MKATYNISVTYKAEDGVKTDEFTKCIFDYIDNGHYFFVQETDTKIGQDDKCFNNKLHWYPMANIIKISGEITRTFETKAEQKDYYALKNGIKTKGVPVKN